MQLVLLFIVPLLLYLFQRFISGIRKLPPGPTLFQLWSKRFVLAEKPHVALTELAQIHGPIMSLRLGGQLVVVISSPDIAREIHKTNLQIFSGRHFPSVYYNVPGAISASVLMARECNDRWKFLRSIGQNFIFSSKAVESFAGLRKTKVKEMVEHLKMGEAMNVENAIYATFVNIFNNVLVSQNLCDVGGDGERAEKKISYLNDLIRKATVPGLTDMFPILKCIDFWTEGKGMEMYQDIRLFWKDILEQRRLAREANPDFKQDFMDVLSGYSFSEDQIHVVIMELLTASVESNFVTAVWLIAEFIRYPEILHKVRKEIAEKAVEGDELNESRLSECAYLHACIKESFRLHIPGPFGVPHRAIKTCKVGNYTIPKDTMVMVNSWLIQRDHDVYEDPTTFKPERFLDSKIDFRGGHLELLPFGGGMRLCPGIQVAITTLQLVVGSIVHYFDWSLPDGEDPLKMDMSDVFGTSLRMKKPFCFIPTPREKFTVA